MTWDGHGWDGWLLLVDDGGGGGLVTVAGVEALGEAVVRGQGMVLRGGGVVDVVLRGAVLEPPPG